MGWNDDPYASPFLRWVDRNKQRLAVAAVAGVAGLAILMNTVNFGPTQLGPGAPADWMQGQIQYEQVVDTSPGDEAVLQINGWQLEEGRYAYPGIVVIAGDITTDNFRLSADQIIVDGSIDATGVVLEARQAPEEAVERPGLGSVDVDGEVEMTDSRIGSRYTTQINIANDVTGTDSQLRAGEINLAGWAAGNNLTFNGHAITLDGGVDGNRITLNTQFGLDKQHIDGDLYKVSLGGDIVVHGGIYGDGNRVLGGQVQIGGDVEATNLTIEGYLPETHEKDVSIVMVPTPVPNGNGGTTISLRPQTNVDWNPQGLFDADSTIPAVTIAGYTSGHNITIEGNAGVTHGGYDSENVTVSTSFERPITQERGLEIVAPKTAMSPG